MQACSGSDGHNWQRWSGDPSFRLQRKKFHHVCHSPPTTGTVQHWAHHPRWRPWKSIHRSPCRRSSSSLGKAKPSYSASSRCGRTLGFKITRCHQTSAFLPPLCWRGIRKCICQVKLQAGVYFYFQRANFPTCNKKLSDIQLPLPLNCRIMKTAYWCRWASILPACIQVCPVEIPGRGRRIKDNPLDSVSDLADLLVESLPLQVTRYYDHKCKTRESYAIAVSVLKWNHITSCSFQWFLICSVSKVMSIYICLPAIEPALSLASVIGNLHFSAAKYLESKRIQLLSLVYFGKER